MEIDNPVPEGYEDIPEYEDGSDEVNSSMIILLAFVSVIALVSGVCFCFKKKNNKKDDNESLICEQPVVRMDSAMSAESA